MPVDDFVPRPMPEREPPVPRTPSRPPARRHSARTGAVVSIVLVVVMAATVLGYGAWRWASVARTDVALDAVLDGAPENWLVVGSDSRDVIDSSDPDASAFIGGDEHTGGKRSDTIVIVRIDPAAEQVHLLSLPRDLWVPIARTGDRERINTAYSYDDGPQRLIDTIREDFDIEVNHYAEIDFDGFEAIVDAVDGVPMDFEHSVRDTNSGLYVDGAGCHVLAGADALAFARSRHLQYQDGSRWVDDPSGDIGRTARQQQFMLATFTRAASRVRGADVGAINGLIGAVVDHVTLDTQLDTGRAVAVARRFADLGPGAVVTHSLPVDAYTTPGGASVLRLDQDLAQPVLNGFRGLEADALPASQVTVKVSYDPTQQSAATAASTTLTDIGFHVSDTSSLGATAAKTTVRFAPGNRRIAQEVARQVDPAPQLVEDSTYKDGRTVLVVGKDFAGVRAEPRALDAASTGTSPGSSSSTTAAPSTTVLAHPNCDS